MKVKGCIHLHYKKGKLVNIVSHATLPKRFTGVIHLKVKKGKKMNNKMFRDSHKMDIRELYIPETTDLYDLGDDTI